MRVSIPPLQLAFRAALAAALAPEIALRLSLQFPLYAMISAVIVTDLSSAQTRRLGWPRLAGTVVGSTVGATVSAFAPAGPAALAAGIFGAMGLTHLLRLIETVLGIAVAVLVSHLPKLIPVAPS